MKAAIMQPYLFPYLGYWQLLNAVDCFILLDDVNFIKRGYINRNSILLNNAAHLFTIPIEKSSQNKRIMDVNLKFSQQEKEKFLKMIFFAYKKAKNFETVYPMLENIVMYHEDDLTGYIENSIKCICNYLDIMVDMKRSSYLKKAKELKGEERIIEICRVIGADIYINPIGGVDLYHAETFHKNNIELYFLQMQGEEVIYKQYNNVFVKNLSIIDILMFNTKQQVKELLEQYTLLKGTLSTQ